MTRKVKDATVAPLQPVHLGQRRVTVVLKAAGAPAASGAARTRRRLAVIKFDVTIKIRTNAAEAVALKRTAERQKTALQQAFNNIPEVTGATIGNITSNVVVAPAQQPHVPNGPQHHRRQRPIPQDDSVHADSSSAPTKTSKKEEKEEEEKWCFWTSTFGIVCYAGVGCLLLLGFGLFCIVLLAQRKAARIRHEDDRRRHRNRRRHRPNPRPRVELDDDEMV